MSTTVSIQQQIIPVRQFEGETVAYIPLAELHPFPNQPFKVRDDKAMQETAASIREYGVLTPAIVRPHDDGGYEIVSGHRRKRACELAGIDALPVIVREMDDDAATILLVDSNIQREEILPSERALALKMKLDAVKRQGARNDLTCTQVGDKSSGKKSVQIVAEQFGESKTQVQRYIRLNDLSPRLRQMVDEKQIAFNTGVELSYLMPDEQARVAEAIEREQITPSYTQAQRMKKLSQAGELNVDTLHFIMTEAKKSPAAILAPSAVPDQEDAVCAVTQVEVHAAPPQPFREESSEDAQMEVPFDLGDKQYASFEESIADLKNNDKDCSCTPDLFLAEFTGFVQKFQKEINWFHISYYEVIFPALSPVQMNYLRQQMNQIRTAVDKLYNHVEETKK